MKTSYTCPPGCWSEDGKTCYCPDLDVHARGGAHLRAVPGRLVSRRRALGHTAYHHVGAISDDARRVIGTAIIGAAAYHGYKRTGTVRWAVGYAALAALAPIITGAVVVAQGFGKRKGGS